MRPKRWNDGTRPERSYAPAPASAATARAGCGPSTSTLSTTSTSSQPGGQATKGTGWTLAITTDECSRTPSYPRSAPRADLASETRTPRSRRPRDEPAHHHGCQQHHHEHAQPLDGDDERRVRPRAERNRQHRVEAAGRRGEVGVEERRGRGELEADGEA